MSVEYVDLVDHIAIGCEITGLEVDTVMRVAKLDLADSALHAPVAGFGETEFYPDFVEPWQGVLREREPPHRR